MADLIKAARTRIKKKQEETPSQVDLIEQARINNAYNGGVIRPANISVRAVWHIHANHQADVCKRK